MSSEKPAMPSKHSQKAFDRACGKVCPLFLLALVAFAAYVVVGPIVVQYLSVSAPAAAVLAAFFLPALLILASYLRLALLMGRNPGYTSFGTLYLRRLAGKKNPLRASWECLNPTRASFVPPPLPVEYPPQPRAGPEQSNIDGDFGYIAQHKSTDIAAKQLRTMARRDYYICNKNGYPNWCEHCTNWKDDRVHHDSTTNRCVRRMDHFCPWVGGLISQTTHKFFIQFLFYGILLCFNTAVIMVVSIALMARDGHPIDGSLIAALALSVFFSIFVVVLFKINIEELLENMTIVEHCGKDKRITGIAVRIPEGYPRESLREGLRTITWPFRHPVTFAILRTKAGENPFDLGKWDNVCQLMGNSVWEWFLPITRSPLDHNESREEGYFPINPQMLARLRKDANLPSN